MFGVLLARSHRGLQGVSAADSFGMRGQDIVDSEVAGLRSERVAVRRWNSSLRGLALLGSLLGDPLRGCAFLGSSLLQSLLLCWFLAWFAGALAL